MQRKGQPKAVYPLKEVKALVRRGDWRVNRNALDGAQSSFGWGIDEIRLALLALRQTDYDISDWSKHKPGVRIDSYKARNLKGENVYTHFYIDKEEVIVVVNSFKRI